MKTIIKRDKKMFLIFLLQIIIISVHCRDKNTKENIRNAVILSAIDIAFVGVLVLAVVIYYYCRSRRSDVYKEYNSPSRANIGVNKFDI